MAENEQVRQQELAQEQAKEAVSSDVALCKYCGSALDRESPFCPNCGEKAGGKEYTCAFCRTTTTREFCPRCDRRVISVPCPVCGVPSVDDACENCGAVLNPVLEQSIAQEAPAETAPLSAEETAKIQAEFQALEANETPEFKAFQKKLIERQKLLEIRADFKQQEKRIVKAFGARPFTITLPDPEEEAFRMKAYAALEKTVIARGEKEIEEELERLFPPVAETFDAAEFARREAEMQASFNAQAAQVKSDVEAYKREQERKRLEEERRRLEEERRRLEEERQRREAERQRQIEIARRKLEEALRSKKLDGTYYWGNPGSDYQYIQLFISGDTVKCMHHCGGHGDSYGVFTLSVNGPHLVFHSGAMSYKDCPLLHSNMHKFTGTLNETGTLLTGYWDSQSVTHYKT
jgi:hypothetical protein